MLKLSTSRLSSWFVPSIISDIEETDAKKERPAKKQLWRGVFQGTQ